MTNILNALIIEDNPELNTLFRQALEDAGFETDGILDGQEAETYLKTANPDVILLDLHLPQVSGADLLTQIRQDSRLKETFIIVASADGTWSKIISEKADIVLNKPVSFIQLRDLGARIYQNIARKS